MGYLNDIRYKMYFLRQHEYYATPKNAKRALIYETDKSNSSSKVYINKDINFHDIFMYEQRELPAVCIHSNRFGDVIVSEDTPILMRNNEFILAKEIVAKYGGNSVEIKICDIVSGDTDMVVVSYLKQKMKFRDFIIPVFHYIPINYLLIGDSHIERELLKKYIHNKDNKEPQESLTNKYSYNIDSCEVLKTSDCLERYMWYFRTGSRIILRR